MKEVANYGKGQLFHRNRLPSLYSDFTPQKRTNPDGYAANIAAWEHALTTAARAGQVRSGSRTEKTKSMMSKDNVGGQRGSANHLILRLDSSLLKDLEIPEFGQPVALGAVIV